MKIGDKVKVLVGVYAGRVATIDTISDAPINIGVDDLAGGAFMVWFKKEELERI